MDAIEDVFYEHHARYTTVFQFTLEDYVLGKLRNTIETLRFHKIEFDELVLVTRTSLSPQRQQSIRMTARKDYGVVVDLYERATILNRLSDYSNGIFHRYFPDITQQIADMEVSKPIFRDTDNVRELAVIRTSLAFGVNPESNKTRNSMLDQMVLATLESKGKGAFTSSQVSLSLAEQLGVPQFPDSQIEASLNRLSPDVVHENNKYSLTPEHCIRVDFATIKVNGVTESLISDVVEEVCAALKESFSIGDRQRLERNAKDVLREIFRLNSMQLANMALPDHVPTLDTLQTGEGLLNLAKRQATEQRGEMLLAVLANVISNPTAEQAAILAEWARIYLGAALMNLDPLLRECQITRLREKSFILDTDMVLRTIVRENPTYGVYQELINRLFHMGVQVVVPIAVIAECAKHAARSPRTYSYHGAKFRSPDIDVVQNVRFSDDFPEAMAK